MILPGSGGFFYFENEMERPRQSRYEQSSGGIIWRNRQSMHHFAFFRNFFQEINV